MGEEGDPRQFWVPTEAVRRPETIDTLRRPCTAKGKGSWGSRQGPRWKKKPEIKDMREETTDALGVQQWNKGPSRKRGDSIGDAVDDRIDRQSVRQSGRICCRTKGNE
jgi:hypothetical protein